MNLAVLRRIADHTSLSIQYGGGIKSTDALEKVFDAGADRAICGSIAVRNPQAFIGWIKRFGPERMILGADTRDGRIAIHGWTEASTLGVEELIEQFQEAGLSQVICTDIAKDGMLQGPTETLYTTLQSRFPQIDITVSGGISAWSDIQRLDALGTAQRHRRESPLRRSHHAGSTQKRICQSGITRSDTAPLPSCLRNESFPASTSKMAKRSKASIFWAYAKWAIRSS